MKLKVVIELNTETGEYEFVFYNLSNPGAPIDYTEVRPMLASVFEETDDEIIQDLTENVDLTKIKMEN